MELALKLEHVNLIYKSSESISYKKLLRIGNNTVNAYKALNDISLSIEKGKVYGIIGNNGAGKSTLLRVLSGVMSPNSGKVIRNHGKLSLLALGIGFTKDLTGLDNIFLSGMLLGFSKKEITKVLDDIIDYSELGDFIYRAMKTYSSGMVSRLGFSISINLRPEVLLIDEVLSVGDIRFREKSYASLRSLINDKNITAVIVSHSINQVEDICDKVVWLDKGRIVTQGDKNDVLDIYLQFINDKFKLDDIMQNNDSVREDEKGNFIIDASHYIIRMQNPEIKYFMERKVDSIQKYSNKNGTLKLTKRQFENKDLMLFIEYIGDKVELFLQLDTLMDIFRYDQLYKTPPYDNRYGTNKLTGLYAYCDLNIGSAVISNVYDYKELVKQYTNGAQSTIYELVNENPIIEIDKQGIVHISMGGNKCNSTCFILLSNEKLFNEKDNLNKYMEYFYEALYNNSVWNSFFCTPAGTYTKLPYSIEPFTKDGYGYSIHHSSRRDMMTFYIQTKERFYEDFIYNAVIQAYLYHNRSDGVFFTTYTSTWIKESTGITAPYIDTRLNENFVMTLHDFQKSSNYFSKIDPLKEYVDFLFTKYEMPNQIYHLENGVFFPDYFNTSFNVLSHSSLNHQLGIALMLLQAWEKYKIDKYKTVFNAIIRFIELTSTKWKNEISGDLYYSIKITNAGKLIFYDNDYVYVTLLDMLHLQNKCIVENYDRLAVIDELISIKIKYLKKTKYNIFSDNPQIASGEKTNSANQALKLYQKIYSNNK